ncbi:MAG: bifunctional phosphopantothenoylcysteine decarboxylase/phosphopantothenate--cysteine ligase CoaBC [Synergistaceae bacterium]|nr:bifunctional phosphopantothenoylcysteine decarboxylase/phosphopantothenate--cysteine ligase CoaBC [Synergistaceae bacterium]
MSRILLGVTGGIAAYKAPEVTRAFIKEGHEVEIILTEAGEQFVSPLALATLLEKKIWRQSDFLSSGYGWQIPHISLSRWADVLVIAPCTAETLSGLASGRAESLLSATALALPEYKPVVVFPAMNTNMLSNAATVENMRILNQRGIFVIDPDSGMLACGEEGRGRLPSPEDIIEETRRAVYIKSSEPHKLMLGKKVLITSGATQEYIDPVRFISNASSGKMGAALARTAWRRGAEVRVILGAHTASPVHGVNTIDVISAYDMLIAVLENLEWADIIVKAAAVSDYRAENLSDEKIKREGNSVLSVNLIQNPDIAFEIGKLKRDDQILVGFALETDNMIENAVAKMKRKNMDRIILNGVRALGADINDVTLIRRNGSNVSFDGSKEDIANGLWDDLS